MPEKADRPVMPEASLLATARALPVVVPAMALTTESLSMAASRDAPLVSEPRSMPMLKPTEKALAAPVLVMA